MVAQTISQAEHDLGLESDNSRRSHGIKRFRFYGTKGRRSIEGERAHENFHDCCSVN